MGLTRCPVVAPARLRSHERSISFSWKARTFSIATLKLSSSSGERDPRILSISLLGTRISCGRTPSKRSVYSRRAASPLSGTSSTIQRAESRTVCERKPPGRRNSPTISAGPLPRASIFLTNAFAAPLHRVGQGYDLAVAQAVGAAVGGQTRRRGGDLLEHQEVVLAQRRTCGGWPVARLLPCPLGRPESYGTAPSRGPSARPRWVSAHRARPCRRSRCPRPRTRRRRARRRAG